jgi:hypothetical protein
MHAFISVASGKLYVRFNIFCYKSVKLLSYGKREEMFRQVDFEKKKQRKGTTFASKYQ